MIADDTEAKLRAFESPPNGVFVFTREQIEWLVGFAREKSARLDRALSEKGIACCERDAAEKAAAAMRGALQPHLDCFDAIRDGKPLPDTKVTMRQWEPVVRAALASDAGRDFVPRADWDMACQTVEAHAAEVNTARAEREENREAKAHFQQLWIERGVELEKARAEAAAMRAALASAAEGLCEAKMMLCNAQIGRIPSFEQARRVVETAIASDAGRGWVGPELVARVIEVLAAVPEWLPERNDLEDPDDLESLAALRKTLRALEAELKATQKPRPPPKHPLE